MSPLGTLLMVGGIGTLAAAIVGFTDAGGGLCRRPSGVDGDGFWWTHAGRG